MSESVLVSANDDLDRLAESHPDSPALIGHGRELSYCQLRWEVERLGQALQRQQVTRGAVVALALEARFPTILLVLALQRLGCTPMPLNPALPAAQFQDLLADARCRYLIGEHPLDELPVNVTPIDLQQLIAEAVRLESEDRPSVAGVFEGPTLILATSGSSGRAKGVMLSAENLAHSARAVNERLGFDAKGQWLCCLPLYHIGGLAILFRVLQAGACLVLHERFSPPLLWQALRERPISHLSLVPAMLAQVLDAAAAAAAPPSLQAVVIGGSAVDRRLVERALAQGWPLCLSYGMTETGSQIATRCLSAGERAVEHDCVGRPLAGLVVDAPACAQHPQGLPIRIKGSMLMLGYAHADGLDGEGLDAGWFDTRDLGCLDAQGQLHIRGRADALIISGGENIHPYTVEELLGQCEGVAAVAVVGRPDPLWGELVVAVFSGAIDEAALAAWTRAHLPSHLRPRQFLRLEHLPQTTLGKVDRAALAELVKAS